MGRQLAVFFVYHFACEAPGGQYHVASVTGAYQRAASFASFGSGNVRQLTLPGETSVPHTHTPSPFAPGETSPD